VLAAVWSAHHLNVRRVVARMKLLAQERARFGRELHDSLLQGFSGVIYLLEASKRKFEADPNASRQHLEKAIGIADRSVQEARQLIVTMRISALENNSLPEALKTMAAQTVSGLPVVFQLDVKGRDRKSPYNVEANLFLIAREALKNAVDHASAKHIRLELWYSSNQLRVTIVDDGTGFDLKEGIAKKGHWGLRGMQERARTIGAECKVDSSLGKGTTIQVTASWKK
jgi:signal transduction histidine kinase